MSAPFIAIYRLFRERKPLFVLFILGLFSLALYQGLKLRFEEDISQMMPTEEGGGGNVQKALGASDITNDIIFHVRVTDTASRVPPDSLIAFSDDLVNALKDGYAPGLISKLRYRVSDSSTRKVFDTFHKHLPIFLSASDYERIDSLTRPSAIKENIEEGYRTLMSPASAVMKKFILRDPVGVTSLALKKLEKLRPSKGVGVHRERIMDSTRQHLFFFATPAHPPSESGRNAKLVHGIDSLSSAFNERHPHLKVEYFGSTPVTVANAEQIKADIYLTVSVAVLVLLILVAFFFRGLRSFFLIFVPVLLGGGLSIGIIALFWEGVSAIALGMGSVMLGITIDYSLHILTHFRNSGSAERTLKDLSTPVLMSAATTASAFICLLFLRAPAMHDLGRFAALSVTMAALMALIVLPQFMRTKWPHSETKGPFAGLLERVAAFPLHRKKAWVAFVILFSILCAFTYGKVGFEDDLSEMNYMPEHLKKAQERIKSSNEYAHRSIHLLSSGSDLDQALSRDRELGHVLDSLKRKGIIDRTVQPGRFLIPTALQKERIRRWEAYWSKEKRQEVRMAIREKSQELGFKPDAFASFYELLDKDFEVVRPQSFEDLRHLFLDEYIAEGEKEATVASLLKVASDAKAEQVFKAIEGKQGVSILDEEYMATRFIRVLKEDFSTLVGLSLLIVFGILLLVFGRLELTLITFLPMTLGWLWTVGLMGLFGVEFNIFNIVICTFVFGLGIDHSIFITRGYLQDFKYGEKGVRSYKTSILLSAITTIVGFGVLIFAEHPALRSIATMSVIGIFSVVLVAFTLQPLLFDWMILSRKRMGQVPMTFSHFLASQVLLIVFLLGCIVLTLMGAIFLIPPRHRNKKRKLFYHKLVMGTCRFIIYFPFHIRKRIINEGKVDMKRPAVIISNHRSHIDLPLILMLHPKLIVLTTDWVWNNPFYGAIVKLCDYYPVSMGHDRIAELLEDKVKDGYSVLVFPEGTRSPDQRIQRFHKGGFYLAEKLGLDLLPIMIHGAGDVMPKGDNRLQEGRITMRIMERIPPGEFGKSPRDMAKAAAAFYREEYRKMKGELEGTSYFRGCVIRNYIMKGPQLEWYLKSKFWLEAGFEAFEKRIPKKADIVDLGCGYGHIDLLLALLSEERRILGVDHDEEKVRIAKECPSRPEHLTFDEADITEYEIPESDVFILGDVLHYLPLELQKELIGSCVKRMRSGGSILIRDADKDLQQRHLGTRWTEFISTRSGFNKTRYQLEFMSGRTLRELVESYGMELEVEDKSNLTSNRFYVIREAEPAPS